MKKFEFLDPRVKWTVRRDLPAVVNRAVRKCGKEFDPSIGVSDRSGVNDAALE